MFYYKSNEPKLTISGILGSSWGFFLGISVSNYALPGFNASIAFFVAPCFFFMAFIFLSKKVTKKLPTQAALKKIYYSYGFFILYIFLSTLLGTENQADRMQFLFTLPMLPVLTYVICLNFPTKDRILSAFLVVVACGSIYTIYTSFFYTRAYGITEGANSSAVVLVAGLILFLYRLIASKRRLKRKYYAFFAIVIFCAIFLTGSRTGYLTLATAWLCMFFLIRQNKKIMISIIAILVIFTLPIIKDTHQFQRIVSAIEVVTMGESDKTGSRTVLRRTLADRVAYEMFLDNPLLGIGIGKSTENLILYSQLLSKSHNSYALLLSETGLLGSALYLIFLFNIFVLLKNMRKTEQRIWTHTLAGKYQVYAIFPNFLMIGYISILVSAYFWPVFREKLFWVWLSIVAAQLADEARLKFSISFKTGSYGQKDLISAAKISTEARFKDHFICRK